MGRSKVKEADTASTKEVVRTLSGRRRVCTHPKRQDRRRRARELRQRQLDAYIWAEGILKNRPEPGQQSKEDRENLGKAKELERRTSHRNLPGAIKQAKWDLDMIDKKRKGAA